MAIPLRPGTYNIEYDNSISLQVGGLGAIGIAARLDKGEVGRTLAVTDRNSLVRIGGKPIPRFNTEDWLFVDNIFYYTGNVLLSRVEDTDHVYRAADATLTIPCSNSQVVIYSGSEYVNPNHRFDNQAILKALPTASADRRTGWEAFLDDFLGDGDDADATDFSFLVLNSLKDAQEKYEEDRSGISRTPSTAIISLTRDEYGEYDEDSEEVINYLTSNSIAVEYEDEYKISLKSVAKISNVSKVVSIADSYFYGSFSDEWAVGNRVFVVQLEEVGTESTLPSGTYVIDEDDATPYLEIGTVVASSAGTEPDVDIEYTTTRTLHLNDIIVCLSQAEIDAAEGTYEREKILNAFLTLANSGKLGIAGDNPGRTWTYDTYNAIDEAVAFNFVYLNANRAFTSTTATVTFICYDNFTKIDDVSISHSTTTDKELFRATAKTPGRWADRETIQVMICDMANFDEYATDYFDTKPEAGESTTYAMDQIAVIVWSDGSIVERYIASLNPTAKSADGGSKYFGDLINLSSQYVYITINEDAIDVDGGYVFDDAYITNYTPEIVTISGGNSSTKLRALATTNNIDYSVQWASVQAVKEALRVFEDKSSVAIEYLTDGAFAGQAQIKDEIIRLCATIRRDCVAVVGPKSTTFQGVAYASDGYDRLGGTNTEGIDYRTWVTSSADNQFAAFYANTKQVYDSINDQTQWISCSSDAVGLNAAVDRNQERWYAVAGTRRGVLTNIIKLGWYPDDTTREYMTRDRVNPIIYVRGDGNIIYDTMSMCSLNSDLSEFYNRKTLNYLQTNTETYMRRVMFEFNDEPTRLAVIEALTPFYRSVYNRRGLYEPALLQCDARNNPASVVEQNMLYVDISLKLQHVAKRVVLRYRVEKASATLEFVSEQ